MKKQIKILCCATAISLATINIANANMTTTVISSSQQKELNIAIYNENIALIKDTRQVHLTQGTNKISYENISAQIIPESALLNGSDIAVIEQNFNYDLITPQSLLSKSVGEEVILETTNDKTGEKEQKNGRLIAYNGEPIVTVDGQIYTHFNGNILLKNMPKGLISKPSLSLDVKSAKAGNQDLGLTYLSRGLSWQANYVAEFNKAEDKINLNGFITLSNQSGTDFENANMQLVAGDVKVVRAAMPRMMMARAKNADYAVFEANDSAMPVVEDVSDFYVYTLPFKTSVLSQQTKQVSLLSTNDISVQKEYMFDNTLKANNMLLENVKAEIVYRFDNTKNNKLGIALPKGIIRLYKESTDGKAVFLGENTIHHTPNTATVKLKMGEAFDVYANAKRIEYQKFGRGAYSATYEVTLQNGSSENKTVTVYENFSGNWKISQETHPYTKETANRVKWTINVPANGKTVLTYHVQVTNE